MENSKAEEVQVQEKQQEQEVDPFTRLMFGTPPSAARTETKQNETPAQEGSFPNYDIILEQVDSIMESVNRLKPLVKELSPLLDLIRKK